MMRTRLFLLSLAAVSLAVSCKPESKPEEPGDNPSQASVLKATLPSEGPLGVYLWTEYDQIRVGDAYYDIKEGAGTRTAVFDGTPAQDSYYMIAYPSDITGVDRYLSYAFDGQYQKGNGSVEHLINTVFIEDVTTWEDIIFSGEWAESKGGTFRCNGVVAFELNLPTGIGTPESITLEAAGVKFPLNNSGSRTADALELHLQELSSGTQSLKAFLSVSEKALTIPAGALKLTVTGETSCSVMLPQEVKMGSGILTEISVFDASAWTTQSVIKGEGTEASPYILKTADDVAQMKSLLKLDGTVWFELGADIDMSTVLNWEPLNTADPYSLGVHFDGKNHTISNFTCEDEKYSSFFGVLNGYCGNVTFSSPVIRHTTKDAASSSLGVLGGYGGSTSGLTAVVENVSVLSGLVTSGAEPEGYFPIGGLFGNIANTSVTNCTYDGKVENNVYATGNNPDRSATGAIAGRALAGSSITGCSVRGEVTSHRSRYTGGILGWASPDEDIPITDCSNFAAVTGGVDRAGGIVGHYQMGTIKNCVNQGNISCNLSGSISGAGGIVGYSGAAHIVGCVNEGNITGTKNAVGGIIGYAELVSTIERCSSSGVVKSTGGRYVGGIAGGMKVSGSVIENCYSTGKIIAEKDQEGAGIIGSLMAGMRVSCCYSTAEVEAARVAGGIVGRACNNAWAYGTASNGNDTIEKCIAWNPSVKASQTGDVNTAGGSGAIVGFTCFSNTLSGGWRIPTMEFQASDTENNTLCDQPDCSPSSPYVMGTTPGTSGKYGCPYHGKAAAASATVSSLAADLGWDASVWNLSNAFPVLK